jgi:hypothetical protein
MGISVTFLLREGKSSSQGWFEVTVGIRMRDARKGCCLEWHTWKYIYVAIHVQHRFTSIQDIYPWGPELDPCI